MIIDERTMLPLPIVLIKDRQPLSHCRWVNTDTKEFARYVVENNCVIGTETGVYDDIYAMGSNLQPWMEEKLREAGISIKSPHELWMGAKLCSQCQKTEQTTSDESLCPLCDKAD